MDHTISLATDDRRRSFVFYRDGLGLEAFGPLADDGVPEPLQLRLASSVSLMLIPTGGFGWVVGEGRVAPPGANECVLAVRLRPPPPACGRNDREARRHHSSRRGDIPGVGKQQRLTRPRPTPATRCSSTLG